MIRRKIRFGGGFASRFVEAPNVASAFQFKAFDLFSGLDSGNVISLH